MGVGHAQLLALIDVRGTAVHVQQQADGLRGARGFVAPAGGGARLVVVAVEQARPAGLMYGALLVAQRLLERGEFERHGVPLGAVAVEVHVGEHEEHVELAVGRVGDDAVARRVDARGLAHGDEPVAAGEHLAAHLLQVFVHARPVGAPRERRRVALLAHRVILDQGTGFARQLAVGVVGLGDLGDHVHAEAVDAAIHPPVHHVVHRAAHVRVLPVQIRLLLGVLVQEVFAALLVILPGGAAEVGAPMVRLGAGGARLVALAGGAPDVPVGVRVVPVARSLEPGVLVGGVVDHQVHDDLQAALVGLGQHLVHVGERAEHRVDVLIVGDVIAVVVLRGLEHRGQPQHVHAQTGQIVQARGDALDVAHAVVVRILEAARIDLVDDRVRPPGVRGRAVRTHRVGQCGTLRSGHRVLPFLPAVPPRARCACRSCGRRRGWRRTVTSSIDSCCIAPGDRRVAYAYIPDVRYRTPSIHHLQQAVNPAFPYHFPQNNAVSARIGIM